MGPPVKRKRTHRRVISKDDYSQLLLTMHKRSEKSKNSPSSDTSEKT